MLGMWDVEDVKCWRCGMLGTWDIEDVGCWRCGTFRMWRVQDVRYWGYGIFMISNVWDVECAEYGTVGMWDNWDKGCFPECEILLYKKPRIITHFHLLFLFYYFVNPFCFVYIQYSQFFEQVSCKFSVC